MVHVIAALLTAALTAGTGTGTIAPRCVEPAPVSPSDYMYTFSTTGESGDSNEPTSGTVRVHGDRTRIDIDKSNSRGYILLTDNGTRMISVHQIGRAHV